MAETEVPQTINNLDALLQRVLDARKEYDDKKEISTQAYHRKTALEMEFLEELKKAGKDKWNIPGLGTASCVHKLNVTTAKTIEAKRALFEYVMNNYGEDVAFDKFSMHSKTLISFYNEELAKATDPSLFSLPGIESPTSEPEFRFRKG